MTWAAPIERTSSTLPVLHTPVTSAPSAAAICTAYVPTPPAAPLTSTRCPGCTSPTSRIPRRAVVAAIGTAAACSNVRPAGLGTTLSASARATRRMRPGRSRHLVTGLQPAHVGADRLDPARRVDPGHPDFGLVSPTPHQPRDERVAAQHVPVVGVERSGVHPDQHVVGADLRHSVSTSRNTSGGPNRSCTMAFMGCPLRRRTSAWNRTRPLRACHSNSPARSPLQIAVAGAALAATLISSWVRARTEGQRHVPLARAAREVLAATGCWSTTTPGSPPSLTTHGVEAQLIRVGDHAERALERHARELGHRRRGAPTCEPQHARRPRRRCRLR